MKVAEFAATWRQRHPQIVLKKESLLKIVIDGLSILRTACEGRGMLGLTDLHVLAESFFCPFLNEVYGPKRKVSTVFSRIAVEKALNDFLIIHFLLLDNVYLQVFFAENRDRMLRADVGPSSGRSASSGRTRSKRYLNPRPPRQTI